jgi:hypothetical protein
MKKIKSFKQFESFSDRVDEDLTSKLSQNDALYRSIKKYYRVALTSWLDDNDDDRIGINTDGFVESFVEDCVSRFGENGIEEYNSGYDNELVREVSRQVLSEND